MDTSTLTAGEAIAFGRRLEEFANGLAPHEHTFLKTVLITVLRDAEIGQDDGSDQDGGDAPSLRDIIINLHLAYLSPSISLNPQPIPLTPRGPAR